MPLYQQIAVKLTNSSKKSILLFQRFKSTTPCMQVKVRYCFAICGRAEFRPFNFWSCRRLDGQYLAVIRDRGQNDKISVIFSHKSLPLTGIHDRSSQTISVRSYTGQGHPRHGLRCNINAALWFAGTQRPCRGWCGSTKPRHELLVHRKKCYNPLFVHS